ncbi:TRAP transporter small permease [Neobacillus sp. NPDC093182]|uniref:TRAP transporter small permease n=1 Tax=Neobacillus sp. NPDC093182 TaxID=3364297 RepID=UPI00380177DA
MKTIRSFLDKLIMFVGCVFTIIMVIGAIWQVFSRYVLGDPSTITEELLRFGLIWTTMLGASYAFGKNEHLAITGLLEKLKGQNQKAVRMVNDLFIIGFAGAVMIKGGLNIVNTTMAQLTPILQIPVGVIYSIVPISGTIIIIYQLLNMPDWLKKKEEIL